MNTTQVGAVAHRTRTVSEHDIELFTAITAARTDKPVTTLATRVTNQTGVTVLDCTAVVWRDPAVAAATRARYQERAGRTGTTRRDER